MGRSGGGSGGGFSSGGFSSGGRSSGGFSSSGRSYSGGRSSWGSFGGYSRGYSSSPIFINNSRRYYGGGNGRRNGNDGNLSTIVNVIFIIIFIVIAGVNFVKYNSSFGKIDKSTIYREKLPASAVIETDYFTDLDGWFSSASSLEKGMKSFYKETGVQPYLYLLPNGQTTSIPELQKKSDELYETLFKDEGHFILVFCDDNMGGYNCAYTVGSEAKTVMDKEAIGILADYLERYYRDSSISEEEVFSNTFEKTGKRIMTVTKSPLVPIAICVCVVVVAVLAYITIKKNREQRAKEQKNMEDILKTPLEKFDDMEVEDLAKKYADKE